jgi:tetratricopeptide (TPR) repeat protein
MRYGIAYYNIGNFAQAEEAFKTAIFVPGHASDPQALGWLAATRRARANQAELDAGKKHYDSGNYSEAAVAFRNVPSRNPQAQRLLNRTEQMQRQYDNAVAEIEALIAKGDSSFWYNSKIGQYDAAKIAADRALKVYTGDLLLTQLKTRTEEKITALNTRKAAADAESEAQAKERNTKVNTRVNTLLDKWLGNDS